ncbi:MAG TPA: NifB/NifX family molybdenum-iron cluster-binding protein [Candidatus Cloacimonadota bacterium]|nr:NifB/NifX family molybdenum-iron cluster-binding protein [Candidatus Cloacimonadota bacterium]
MKIAFTTTGPTWESTIDPRFGRTDYLLLFDEEKNELTSFDNRAVNQVAHGAGPQTAQHIFDYAPDVLITGNGPGGNAAAVLERIKIRIITGAGGLTAKEAYNAFKQEGNAKS